MAFSEGLAAVQIKGQWGFVDKKGNEVIPLKFANAHGFSDGLARVNIGGTVHGYLSRGDEVVDYIMEGGKEGYIDKSGKLSIESKFSWALSFDNGLAKVNRGGTLDQHGNIDGGKWGIIDKTGRLLAEPVYDSIADFEEGLAAVKVGQLWGFINAAGNLVIQPRFQDYCHFSEGLAAVHEGNHLFGYIDMHGSYRIEQHFSVAGDFVEGLAPASSDGRNFGFIDKSGAWAIKPIYYMVDHFSEGFALIHFPSNEGLVRESFGHLCKHGGSLASSVKGTGAAITLRYEGGGFVESSKKSFIDRQGGRIVRAQYEDARGFRDGMAAVKINGKWGYLAADER
jgi:hypothetical protein